MECRAICRSLAIAFFCCGFVTTARAQPSYRIVDLGVVNAGCSLGSKLNESGQAIVSGPGIGGKSNPFLVDTNGSRIDMGSLFGFGAGAWAINSAAQVIGASPTDSTGTRNKPFFWSQQTGMIDLAPSAPSSSFPTACGINNDGDIVGTINNRGVLWTNGRQLYDLNSLNISGLSSWDDLSLGSAINDAGEILGEGHITGSRHTFFLVPTTDGGLSPFLGKPVSLPGQVLAANFDNGGEGVAYHDSTPGNTGGAYRNTDVDLQASSEGGNNVGWTATGEWLNYTVNVTASGNYTVGLRVASPNGGATLHVGFNGPSLGTWRAVSIPPTGGWQTWTTVSVPVTLGAGVQQLTIYFDTGGLNLLSAQVGP